MVQQQGWIKLNRGIQEHSFWQEERVFSRAEAWIDLLLSANYTPGKVMINSQMVPVEAGDYCTTTAHLAKKWGWSRSKVDRFISVLESEQMAVAKRTSKYTVVTILNWAKYQSCDIDDEHETDMKRTSNGHETDIKRTQSKERKESKKVRNNKEIYIKKNEPKKKYGEFENVLLTDEELEKLKAKFADWHERIESLSGYMKSYGKKYTDHYATILNWARMDAKKAAEKAAGNASMKNKTPGKQYDTDDIDLSIFEE